MKVIRVSGVDLAVVDQGQGTPLLLAHGAPFDHAMWAAQIAEFSPSFRVIAPDLRGFGASQAVDGPVSMERFADDLDELLDALGVNEPIVYCGLSMGGYIAWQFVRKYSQRLRALILCDTRAKADTPEAAANRYKIADHVLRAEGTQYVADAMLPKLFAPATRQNRPEIVEPIRQTILKSSPQGIYAAQHAMATRPDVTSMLPGIEVPTLLIVGEHDALSTPDEMRAIAEAIPNAEFHMIAGAGHMTPLEEPAEFNAILARFLRRVVT